MSAAPRFTVTIDDCPHEDVLNVVEGGEPSNALVLYVRCMCAAERESDSAHRLTTWEIIGEVVEACHLDARLYSLSEEDARFVAQRIAEAADIAHLRGEKSPL